MLSEAGAQPAAAAPVANDDGVSDATSSAPASAAADDNNDDANAATTTASSFLNSINAQGASHEEEEEDFRSALEEEVERIVAQRAEYFEVLQKAAAGRLSDEAIQLIGNMRALVSFFHAFLNCAEGKSEPPGWPSVETCVFCFCLFS